MKYRYKKRNNIKEKKFARKSNVKLNYFWPNASPKIIAKTLGNIGKNAYLCSRDAEMRSTYNSIRYDCICSALMNFATSSARHVYRNTPSGELYPLHDQVRLAVKFFVYTHLWGGLSGLSCGKGNAKAYE